MHSYHAAAVLNLFEEGKLSPHTVRKIKSIFIFTIGSLSENFKYLGTIDHFQKHVPQIFFKYTIKAVDGNAEDQFNLARCFEMGIGTPVSIADAIDWYKKSADIEA